MDTKTETKGQRQLRKLWESYDDTGPCQDLAHFFFPPLVMRPAPPAMLRDLGRVIDRERARLAEAGNSDDDIDLLYAKTAHGLLVLAKEVWY